MSCWGLRLVIALVLEGAGIAHKCNNAAPKTHCYKEVMHAMLHGFARHPKDYPGLSIKSSFTEFQAFFHNAMMNNCPMPCMAQEEPCMKFGPNYPGMDDVKWAKRVGIVKHPEWYPELPYPATDKQIASVLYKHGVRTCPRPCDAGEEEGHFVPVDDAPVYADSEGWLTSTTLTPTATRTRTATITGTQTSATSATTTSRTATSETTISLTDTTATRAITSATRTGTSRTLTRTTISVTKALTTLQMTTPPATEPATVKPQTTEPLTTMTTVTIPPQTTMTIPPPTPEPATTEPQTTEPPAAEPLATEPPATEPPTEPAGELPATKPASESETEPATEPATTEPPTAELSATEPPTAELSTTEPPTTIPPQTTMTIPPPTTEPPTTEPPTTEPPTTEPPTTEPPTTEPPTTEPPMTTQHATEAPTTREPATVPTTEHPTTLQPTSTKSSTELPSPTASPATSPEENGCFTSGKSLTPMDAGGYTPVSRDSSEECQAHCKLAKSDQEIGHFLYYEPFNTCHCPPATASESVVGPEFMSGPLACQVVLDDASIEVPSPASVASRMPAVTAMVGFAAAAVMGSSIFALRRRPLATTSSWDAEALLDEESRGSQFTRSWPESDSAEE